MPSSRSGPLSLWVKCKWALRGQQPATLLCKGMTHRAQKKKRLQRRGGGRRTREGTGTPPPSLSSSTFPYPRWVPTPRSSSGSWRTLWMSSASA